MHSALMGTREPRVCVGGGRTLLVKGLTAKLTDSLENPQFNTNPTFLVPAKWAGMLYRCKAVSAATS